MDHSYSAAIVGTGFASSFFLLEYLRHAAKDERILVLERGRRLDHSYRVTNKRTSDMHFAELLDNRTPQKEWVQNIAFGGGSCWTGNAPRMHPNDFRTKTLYGVGTDWPLTYDELEPYFLRVEQIMGIAGSEDGPFPRSAPYPFPAHRLNAFDELLAKKYPGQHVPLPTARSSSVGSGRPVCCGNGICATCPIGSKFQCDMHLAHIYEDPRVELRLESEVERLDIQGNKVIGVHFRTPEGERYARADLAVVGAHAIMSPFILLRSGLQDRALGHYLNEQISVTIQVDLDGVDNFGGSTAVTGLGLMYLDGPFRAHEPAFLLENWNLPWLRAERGRWRQRAIIKFVFEDIPEFDNSVSVSSDDPTKPAIFYPKHSAYMRKGIESVSDKVEKLIAGLPVESYQILPMHGLGGSAHIQGTTRMGTDPNDSVVDRDSVHHSVRNLVVLGSGTFPTCMPANPTLPLSVLATRAAERLFGASA